MRKIIKRSLVINERTLGVKLIYDDVSSLYSLCQDRLQSAVRSLILTPYLGLVCFPQSIVITMRNQFLRIKCHIPNGLQLNC